MKLLLSPVAKTVPSNYDIQGIELSLGIAPGESCTEEQWEKAKRMESEFWDWESYMRCQIPTLEHPEYLQRAEEAKVFTYWEAVLNELEPLPRLP